MIKLTRIDDRLLHGQVAFTWVPALGVDCLLVANDKVAKDEFQKMTMNLAKPVNTKLLIRAMADAIVFLNDEKNSKLKILVLINSIQDAAALARGVSEIRSVNFGGIRGKEGSRLISKAVAITDADLPVIKEMLGKNIELEIRQVPTDSRQMVEGLMLVSFFFITLIAVFGHSEDFLGTTLLSRPLVLAPLVGLALGDLNQGVIIGATLELIFMGNIKVGAAIPPDVITGGVLSTAFAILSGKGPAIALALAVPISILAEMVISGLFVFRSVFNKKFIQYAEEGSYRKIQRLHILSGLLKPLLMGLITFAALQLGADVMKKFLDLIPAWVNEGLKVAGNLLPALGFALLLNLMFNKKVAPYFFLGFILSSYLKLPVIAIGGLGVIAALIITDLTHKPPADDGEGESGPDQEVPRLAPKLPKRTIRALFFRSLALEANFNFETWQNSGFAFAIIPALKKLYLGRERMAAALKRHLQFFNTSPYGSTLIIGIIAAMEEQNSRATGDDFDPESINSVKLGLMGPLAGVFDSLFWGTFKVIAAGVGVSLAIKGNILGPILFLLIFNLPHLILRYHLTFIGYNTGTRFLQNLARTNVMDKLTAGSSILGLMVIGAMTATLMNVGTPIIIGGGDSPVHLQSILDQIVPNIIPLGITFLTYHFIKKNIKTTWLLLGLLTLGFIGSIAHVLA